MVSIAFPFRPLRWAPPTSHPLLHSTRLWTLNPIDFHNLLFVARHNHAVETERMDKARQKGEIVQANMEMVVTGGLDTRQKGDAVPVMKMEMARPGDLV